MPCWVMLWRICTINTKSVTCKEPYQATRGCHLCQRNESKAKAATKYKPVPFHSHLSIKIAEQAQRPREVLRLEKVQQVQPRHHERVVHLAHASIRLALYATRHAKPSQQQQQHKRNGRGLRESSLVREFVLHFVSKETLRQRSLLQRSRQNSFVRTMVANGHEKRSC